MLFRFLVFPMNARDWFRSELNKANFSLVNAAPNTVSISHAASAPAPARVANEQVAKRNLSATLRTPREKRPNRRQQNFVALSQNSALEQQNVAAHSVAAFVAAPPTVVQSDVLLASVDIHCHLLPAWDDGARDLNAALEMARLASLWGCEAILVTPHVGRAFTFALPDAKEIPIAVAAFERRLRERGQLLRLVPGAEVALTSPAMLERIFCEPELSVGGMRRHVLVEAPSAWPDWVDGALVSLAEREIAPILAHPERFSVVQRDPHRLSVAMSSGALVQITAGALTGQMGRSAQKCALALLDLGWVSFIASDAHDPGALWPSQVADLLRERVGEQVARLILQENPRRLLRGEQITVPARRN